jgi:hypothetical protein
MPQSELKRLIAEGIFIGAPGVFDMISAKIADASDALAIYITGYGTVASHLGLPDAGLASLHDTAGEWIGAFEAGSAFSLQGMYGNLGGLRCRSARL